MRVAMIDPSLFTLPYDDHICAALFDRGHDVTLFTRPLRDGEPSLRFDYRRSERFYRLAEDRRLGRLPAKARLALKAAEHVVGMGELLVSLRRLEPDVIHFQWLAVPSVDRFSLPLLGRIAPLFMTVHDSKGFLNPTSRLQMIGWDAVLRSFDGLIVHLEASRRELLERGVAGDRIHVIPHGVLSYDESAGEEPAEEPPAEDAEREILLFGAIKPYKGTDVLIRAMAELPEAVRRRARVVVVGEPFQDMDELRGLASRLGVADRIRWDTRYVPNEEIPAILRRADIIAYPYRRIDASGVLMMTLPYAKPIVATAVGCFAELLEDGRSALIVPPEDPRAFARALERLIVEPELGRELGRQAREMALGQLSWEKIAESTEAAYRAAAAARR